jgi:uncharacterized protein YbaR (Trm112 family)
VSTNTPPSRLLQFATAAIVGIFLLGLVFSPVGAWAGPILAAWFIGTQKPWSGFAFLAGISFLFSLLYHWRGSPLTGIAYPGWTMVAAIIGVVPFLFYRRTSQRRQGFLSTLSLPLWGVAVARLAQLLLPASIFNLYFLTNPAASPSPRLAAILGTSVVSFLIYWLAAVLVWMWNQEFRAKKIATGAGMFAAACVLVLGYVFFAQITHRGATHVQATGSAFAWICLAGGLVLTAGSFLQPDTRREAWANKAETVALLRSPYTGDSLQVVSEGWREALVSQSGERFPIRNGIPIFLDREKLTGLNQKYNRLYETIGGFYDDTQRAACALKGTSPEQYLWDYLRFLEIKPGDSVLETSVGTGLNYKYLPRGVKLFGLDLSAEMLTNCQANLPMNEFPLPADILRTARKRSPLRLISYRRR